MIDAEEHYRETGEWQPVPVSAPPEPTLRDASTWAINREEETIPQLEVEAALADEDNWCVVFVGGNRGGKTRSAVRICTKTVLGAYDWAPEPANVALVAKSGPTASTSIEEYLQEFVLYGLPLEIITRRTTKGEITTPIRLANRSRLDIKTEGMGAKRIQGAGYNLVNVDEFPEKRIWKELRARVKAGARLKFLVTMTPTEGSDWFYYEVILPALEGKRKGIKIIANPTFWNGVQGCPKCGKDTEAWDSELRKRGMTREWKFHWDLKKLCGHCHAFGTWQRIDPRIIVEWEEEYHGAELWIRLYGDPGLELRGAKCFSPDEIKFLKGGTEEPRAEAGMLFWGEADPDIKYVGGLDAAEGLGKEHSETTCCFVSGVTGVSAGMYADDSAGFESYSETIDWMASKKFAMRNGAGALLVIELKNMGPALVAEYKDRPHIDLYQDRDQTSRSHKSGHQYGWVSHDWARDQLLRRFFTAVRKNLVYDAQKVCTGMRSEPHPRGIWIKDPESIRQLKALRYDLERGNRISKPTSQRDDRIIGWALAHEGRIHRNFARNTPTKPLTGNQSWVNAVLSEREVEPLKDVEWEEVDGILRPTEL